MAVIEESSAYVFLMLYVVEERDWQVRVKLTTIGDKELLEIVDAARQGIGEPLDQSPNRLGARGWEDLLKRTGQTKDFWAAALQQFVMLTRPMGQA